MWKLALSIVCGLAVAAGHAYTWIEGSGSSGDAIGVLPGQDTIGNSGSLDAIQGALETDGIDVYRISISDEAAFSATTVGGSGLDTQLFLFDENGNGVTHNDDDPVGGSRQSRITSTFVTQPGIYFIAITHYNRDPKTAADELIWLNSPANTERSPDGPGAPGPLSFWTLEPTPAGPYTIALTGADVGTQGEPPPPPPVGIWNEFIDAPSLLPGQETAGSGPLNMIVGSISGSNDVDTFCIMIDNPAAFSASLVGSVNFDTQLFLFKADGIGVAFNDDEPNGTGVWSALSSTFVTEPGIYYISISRWDADARSTGGDIWLDEPFNTERAPDGPGAGSPLSSWTSGSGNVGNYTINLTGTSFCVDGPIKLRPTSYHMNRGRVLSGALPQVGNSDDTYMVMRPGPVFSNNQDPIEVVYETTGPSNTPTELTVVVESRSSTSVTRQIVEAFNYSTSTWTRLDTFNPIGSGGDPDTVRTLDVPDPAQYVGPGNVIKMRILYKTTGTIFVYPWTSSVDEASWRFRG
ncbi:MAG: PPC domain-containing protein [Armatimonadetes bacterium]|nr:PPC domain-containing protein [Armatimonadota bacterium]